MDKTNFMGRVESLSSWRAWIEISAACHPTGTAKSLSSWRAWIEIRTEDWEGCLALVALLMESVD